MIFFFCMSLSFCDTVKVPLTSCIIFFALELSLKDRLHKYFVAQREGQRDSTQGRY